MKKFFGEVDLTWRKLIIFAVIAGVVTAVVALVHPLDFTSLHAIAETFEVWILIGIFIIMNSKSNKDSALKCFVFFLISQPLVYLIQVPFDELGFGLFTYYKYWAIWTVLCLPMGYIGYYMKKNKWWGYLILFPMIALTAYSYYSYIRLFGFCCPRYILICIFCICAMIMYPLVVFNDKKIRRVGAAIGIVLAIGVSTLGLTNPMVYSTEIMGQDAYNFDDTYSVQLEDESFGEASIQDFDGYYMVHVDFKKGGDTNVILRSPKGEERVYSVHVEPYTFQVDGHIK